MRLTGIILLMSAIGCASNPSPLGSVRAESTARTVGIGGTVLKLAMIVESEPITKALAASPEGAWAQVAPAYADIGIPLTIFSPQDRLAGNQGLNVRREIGGAPMHNYLNCGDASGFSNADTYLISLNVATQIQKEADGTSKAATVLDATGTSMSLGTNSVHCSSTTELEARINGLIAKRLNLN